MGSNRSNKLLRQGRIRNPFQQLTILESIELIVLNCEVVYVKRLIMYEMKKYIGYVLFMMVFFVQFGCKKESLTGDKAILTAQIFPSVEGEMHNDFLEDVVNLDNFPYHSVMDLYLLGQTYNTNFWNDSLLLAIGFFNEGFVDLSLSTSLLNQVITWESMEDCVDYLNNNYETGLSWHFFNKLIELGNIFKSDSTLYRLNDNRINMILTEIDDFHASVLSMEIPEIEKVLLQKNAEIAYYSMIYWSEVYHNPQHPWHAAIWPLGEEDPPKWWQKALRGLAQVGLDVAGFAAGSTVGWVYWLLIDPDVPHDGFAIGGSVGFGIFMAQKCSSWIDM